LQKSLDLLDGMLLPIHRSRWFRGLSFFRKIAFIGRAMPPQAGAGARVIRLVDLVIDELRRLSVPAMVRDAARDI
jgi:hypothetical protein